MTQRVELADKVCPCGAMSIGAYQPSDATWSYRLLRVAEPRLSVNRMISGTRTYARTLLNGSHSMLSYSFTRTTVPMVYLCRVTLDNWTVYCYDSIICQHNSTDHNADLYLRYCVGKATSLLGNGHRREREIDWRRKKQIMIQKK